MNITAAERMQSLSMTHPKSETPLEDIVEFGGAVYSPDTVVNDELDEPIRQPRPPGRAQHALAG